jgi:hypothetical protein
VQVAVKEIQDILQTHLQNTSTVINVYDDYTFLITEAKDLEEFLDKKPLDMDEVLERITLYEDTITKIRDTMPYEIRMSMFLIECEDLNNKLVNICD